MIDLLKGIVVIFAGTTLQIIGTTMILTDFANNDLFFILLDHSFYPNVELMSK